MQLRFSVDDMGNFAAPLTSRLDPDDHWCMLVDATPEVLDHMLRALYGCCLEFLTIEAGGVSLEIGGDGDGPYFLRYTGAPGAKSVQCNGLDARTAFDTFRKILAGDPNWAVGLNFG